MPIRLAVVDTAELIHVAIREIVAPVADIHFVDAWKTCAACLKAMQQQSLDVLVLGHGDSPATLPLAVQPLRDQYPNLNLIVLAKQYTLSLVAALEHLNVRGFMVRTETLPDFFVGAVYAVTRGDVYISPQTARMLFLAE